MRVPNLLYALAVFLAAILSWPDTALAQPSPPRRTRPNTSVRSVRSALRVAQLEHDFQPGGEAQAKPDELPTTAPSTEPTTAQPAQTGAVPWPVGELQPPRDPAPREYRVPLRAPNLENIRFKAEDGLISLVARDGALSDIITLLAETQGLNIVTADPLDTPVSITLDRVALEDTLDAILTVAGYTWSMNKNIIFITSLSNSTNVSPQAQGVQLQVFTLDYAMARDVNMAIAGMLSPVGSSFIMSSSITESRQSREIVAVQDLPNYLERVREYIGQIDMPPRQVLIEVHVLQVNLDATNKHGVNLDHLFRRNGNMLFEMHTSGFASTSPAQAFTFRFSDGNLTAFLEMLRTTTDAKTLASPRILALNGQQSRIQVGEQLGFRVTTTTETSTTQSVDFLDVGVVLEVTPRISRDGRIMLSVRPEVSSGQVNPDTGLPEEKTTELDTDVLLCDNEGIVIGGLIQETDSDLQQKLPWLGDMHFFGKLFRRKELTKNRKEIIMALVPRLVPYQPPYDQFAAETFMQSHTPLLEGPLERVPRPWESHFPESTVCPPVFRLPAIHSLAPAEASGVADTECPSNENPSSLDSTGSSQPELIDMPLHEAPEPVSISPDSTEDLPGTPNPPRRPLSTESSHISWPSVTPDVEYEPIVRPWEPTGIRIADSRRSASSRTPALNVDTNRTTGLRRLPPTDR